MKNCALETFIKCHDSTDVGIESAVSSSFGWYTTSYGCQMSYVTPFSAPSEQHKISVILLGTDCAEAAAIVVALFHGRIQCNPSCIQSNRLHGNPEILVGTVR